MLAQCWRSGENAALPPMWPGFDSRIGRHMWISLLLLYFAPRGFSPATPVFPGYSGFPPATPVFPGYSGFPLLPKNQHLI